MKKPTEAVPAWQSALGGVKQPDYRVGGRPDQEWHYLRTLGRSSLVDIDVYNAYCEQLARERSSTERRPVRHTAQVLPILDHVYKDIVMRNERVFNSDIPAIWLNNEATRRYLNDLDYYSTKWHSARVFS